jgi:hypothetical protein
MSNLTKNELIKTLKTNILQNEKTFISVTLSRGNKKKFQIVAFEVNEKGEYEYSIRSVGSESWIIEKMTKNCIYIYNYNMFFDIDRKKIKFTDIELSF